MSASTATAEVFMTAFRSLKKKDRDEVINHLLEDRELREDLIDIAVIEQRKSESSRGFREYLRERKRKKG